MLSSFFSGRGGSTTKSAPPAYELNNYNQANNPLDTDEILVDNFAPRDVHEPDTEIPVGEPGGGLYIAPRHEKYLYGGMILFFLAFVGAIVWGSLETAQTVQLNHRLNAALANSGITQTETTSLSFTEFATITAPAASTVVPTTTPPATGAATPLTSNAFQAGCRQHYNFMCVMDSSNQHQSPDWGTDATQWGSDMRDCASTFAQWACQTILLAHQSCMTLVPFCQKFRNEGAWWEETHETLRPTPQPIPQPTPQPGDDAVTLTNMFGDTMTLSFKTLFTSAMSVPTGHHNSLDMTLTYTTIFTTPSAPTGNPSSPDK